MGVTVSLAPVRAIARDFQTSLGASAMPTLAPTRT